MTPQSFRFLSDAEIRAVPPGQLTFETVAEIVALAGRRGHRCQFTLDRGDGQHYVVRIKRVKYPDSDKAYVCVRSGRQYIGIIDPETGDLRLTTNSEAQSDDAVVADLELLLYALRQHEPTILPAEWTLLEHCQCKVCGLWLTHPVSIRRGMGPECAGVAREEHDPRWGDPQSWVD
jgi:hypothetical protein